MTAVLAAGVGARRGSGWAVRAASFRMTVPESGRSALGIWCRRPATSTPFIELLAGNRAPAYGELRVLGHDVSTEAGRAAVRERVGVARCQLRPQPGFRVRGFIEHAARTHGRTRPDRHLMVAAILDRLGLTGWAEVPLRAAPEPVARLARLGAAAVHQPSLLLVDGLLDDLQPHQAASVAAAIRELGRDTAVVAAGRNVRALRLACDEVLELANGIVIGEWVPPHRANGEGWLAAFASRPAVYAGR